MIRTITIEREYGGGGAAIAKKLATQLGWKLWDEDLTREIARRAEVSASCVACFDERVDSMFHRLAKVFMRGSFERSLPVDEVEKFDADTMATMLERVIKDVSAKGNCVIVGRGAPYFLRERNDAFHVFIYAPWEEKIRRVRQLGKSEQEAVDLVSNIDQERATFIRKYFGKEWPNRHLYHLMINSKVGDDLVIRMIVDEIAALNERPVLQQQTAS